MKTLFSIMIIFFMIPIQAYAIINEFDFDFGYDKQIYGINRENSIVSRTYSGGL